MTARFTPGPWLDNLHAGEKRDGGRFYVHVLAKATGIVPVACVPTGVEGYGRDEGRANAVLIAAAPDGYDLAEWIEQQFANPNLNHQAFLVECGIRADRFLAKARGEQ